MSRADARLIFLLIAVSGVGRSIILALATGPIWASFSFVFYPPYFALLGSGAAPYIKSIVPEESNAFAQGVYTVVSYGAGTFLGSYVGGFIADTFGMRNMFALVTVLYIALIPLSFLLIKGKKKAAL